MERLRTAALRHFISVISDIREFHSHLKWKKYYSTNHTHSCIPSTLACFNLLHYIIILIWKRHLIGLFIFIRIASYKKQEGHWLTTLKRYINYFSRKLLLAFKFQKEFILTYKIYYLILHLSFTDTHIWAMKILCNIVLSITCKMLSVTNVFSNLWWIS